MADDGGALSEDVKASGRELARRLAEEPGYVEAFWADPEAAMAAAGLPEGLMDDFATAISMDDAEDAEVEGFGQTVLVGGLPCLRPTQLCRPTIFGGGCPRPPLPPPQNLSAACSLTNWYA
jgi:hypothetical protein